LARAWRGSKSSVRLHRPRPSDSPATGVHRAMLGYRMVALSGVVRRSRPSVAPCRNLSWPWAYSCRGFGSAVGHASQQHGAFSFWNAAADQQASPDERSRAQHEEAISRLAARDLEHAELRSQVGELVTQCSKLTSQVEILTQLLHKSHAGGQHNFLTADHFSGSRDHCDRKVFRPTLEMVANQPTHVSQIGNDALFTLGLQGSHTAHKERLLREIMQVDHCSWEEAHKRLDEMDIYNEKYYWCQSMPYRIGLGMALASAIAGSLMVFYKPVAEAYGTQVAGEDLPEGFKSIADMTTNQVGSWTWTWMEPMIGTASFVLLCFQFARAQAWRLNLSPFTESMIRWRANRLALQYPQYDTAIVRAWGKHLPFVQWNTFPVYRRHLGFKGP